MSALATLLWVLVLIFDTFGQLAFKAAATVGNDDEGFARWRTMLGDKWIWSGIVAYVVEFFLWIAFLSLVPLSQGVLVGSINILTVMLGGRIFFKEALTRKRVIATVLVASGVALVGWG